MSSRSRRNEDLHGNAPDQSYAALLIIDMMNDLIFPGNEELVRNSEALGRNVAYLKRRCRDVGIPSIYVNDNHGKWRSDFGEVVRYSMRPDSLGRKMIEQILPGPDDYLVLKPKHSVFFATPVDTLLEYIGVESVILAGVSTHSCILLSASDAYVRNYQLFVPQDCVAGQSQREHRASLELMESNFRAKTMPSAEIDLRQLQSSGDQEQAA
jgi:nicotinamidase-related amidase